MLRFRSGATVLKLPSLPDGVQFIRGVAFEKLPSPPDLRSVRQRAAGRLRSTLVTHSSVRHHSVGGLQRFGPHGGRAALTALDFQTKVQFCKSAATRYDGAVNSSVARSIWAVVIFPFDFQRRMHVRTSGTNLSCSILLGLVLGIASLGCGKPGDRADKAKADQPALSQSGAEIWQETLAAYRAAESYRDEAVLYLSYRLQGQLIQEPQPWSISWSRGPEQKFSAKLFNAQLRSDGQRLSCYVYDIESANLDNQWLLLEQSGPLPLETLLADNLARYFIGGFSEIPLDESPELNLRSTAERLLSRRAAMPSSQGTW